MSDVRTPTLAEALQRAFDARLLDVHTAIPAVVEEYDAAKRLCSAQPLIMRGFLDERGDRKAELLPVVENVPVEFSGGRVVYPIARGDIVLLIFAESSIDRGWDVAHDPKDDRRHSLSDAFAIPLRTQGPVIEITATEIRVGGTDALAKLNELNNLITAFNGHTHVVATTGTASAQSGTAAAVTSPVSPASGTLVTKGG